MSDLSKSDLLRMIEEGLADTERAIRSHPAATVAVYEQGVQAFLEGQSKAVEPEDLKATGLTVEQCKILRLYLVAMAFMSAWYHRHGDKARRDKAAQSAALLVAGAGLDPEAVFATLLEYETLWRTALERNNIGRCSETG